MALETAYGSHEPDPEDVAALAREIRDTLAQSSLTEHFTGKSAESEEFIDWHVLSKAVGQLAFQHQLETIRPARAHELAPVIGNQAIRTAQGNVYLN